MSTLQQPQTPEEVLEVEFGNNLAARLVDARILSFGANERGEIYLSTIKDGEVTELIFDNDENGEPAIFEVAKEGAPL